jgi:hypothetical protein
MKKKDRRKERWTKVWFYRRMDRQRDGWRERAIDMAVIMFSNNLIMPLPL